MFSSGLWSFEVKYGERSDVLVKAAVETFALLTTGGQIMPFEREMCCDIVSLNLQLCHDSLL